MVLGKRGVAPGVRLAFTSGSRGCWGLASPCVRMGVRVGGLGDHLLDDSQRVRPSSGTRAVRGESKKPPSRQKLCLGGHRPLVPVREPDFERHLAETVGSGRELTNADGPLND